MSYIPRAITRKTESAHDTSLEKAIYRPLLGVSCCFLSCLVAQLISPFPLSAEPEPITEIIIRGSNIEDFLHQAPASVTVLKGEEFESLGADHLQDVLDHVPNLNWAGGSSRPTFFQIRGIGEVEQYEGAPNPSVGVYIDDIDFSGLGGIASLFDIDQVEVLRGPQAIRYGANALAGVIALRSREPTPYFESLAQLSVGSDNLATGGIAVGGPVSGTNNTTSFRFSAYQHKSDGFRDNLFLGRSSTNRRDEFTARLKLKVEPSRDFVADLALVGMDFDNGYDAFAIDNTFKTQSDRPGVDSQGTGAFSVRLLGEVSDSLALRSITTGSHSNQDYSFDGDWGNNPFWEPFAPYDFFSATDRKRSVFSQELRAMSPEGSYQHGETSRWTAGTFFSRLSEDTEIRNSEGTFLYDFFTSDYRANTSAVFGEYELPIAPRTSFRLGSRLENRDTSYLDSRMNSRSPDDLMWGASASIDHEIDNDIRVYASGSRGFKGGGVNVSSDIPDDLRTFNPEVLYSFELGTKGAFFDSSLRINTAIFLALRRDVQTNLSFQSDPSDPLTFVFIKDNAARGRNVGLETEVDYTITPRTRVRVAAALLDSEFTAVDEMNSILEGRAQAQSPRWQYATLLRHQLTERFFAEASLTGKDSYYYQDSHNAKSSSYHLLGAALGFEYKNMVWSVWGRNLLDERYAVRGFFFGNEPPDFTPKEYIQRGDPVQVGTTVTLRF